MNRLFQIKINKAIGFKLLLISFMIFLNLSAKAAGLDLDDTFFRSGKYYVVAGVLTLMFTAIFVFLIRLDRKMSRIEKREKK
jgi:CcmD family protein